jgi:hypothetical protein
VCSLLPTIERVTAQEFATTIAPVIDGVNSRLHQLAAPYAEEMLGEPSERPPHISPLINLRFTLLRGPLPIRGFLLSARYSPAARVHSSITELVDAGWLVEHDRIVSITDRTEVLLNLLYDAHAKAIGIHWATTGVDLRAMAALTHRLLEAAAHSAGPAFSLLSPPFERAGDPDGLLLFNRLAALRYHRSDAHAAAWAAEGLTADQMLALEPSGLRDRIEAETNRFAAAPFEVLSHAERTTVLTGLRLLPGATDERGSAGGGTKTTGRRCRDAEEP